MSITMNSEIIGQLKAGAECLEELPKAIAKGVEACVTVSKETGSAKLIASAMSMEEASLELSGAAKELTEASWKVYEYYKQVNESLS